MAIKLTTSWQSVINKSVYAGGVTTTFYLDARYSTQDIANNITKIYTRLRSVVNYTGAGGTDYEFTCSYCTTRKGSDVWWIDTETILESPETSITHNADGSKILTLAATMKIGYLKLNESMSVDVELPTIPRASTIAVSNGNIGSNVAINIDRASNSFTHTLTYKYGNLSGTIVEKTTSTNINWKLPIEFYTQTPNTSLVGTVYCTTYSGNTQIGETKQDTFTAYVDESTNQPIILGTPLIEVYDSISRTLTGNSKIIIKDYSELNVTITPELHANASLSEYRIVVGNQTKTSQFNNVFNDVSTNVVNAYVKDSRGFKLEGKYPYEFSNLNIVDYFKPKITSINIRRTEQTSTEVIADLVGTYWNKSFGSVTDVASIQYSWRYKLAGSNTWGEWSSWATPTISGSSFNVASLSLGSGYATNTSYDFQIRVKDALSNLDSSQIVVSTSQNVTVSTPIIEVYDDAVNVNGNVLRNNVKLPNALNEYSESTEDTYSCNHLNNFRGKIDSLYGKITTRGVYTLNGNVNEYDFVIVVTSLNLYLNYTYSNIYNVHMNDLKSWTWQRLLYINNDGALVSAGHYHMYDNVLDTTYLTDNGLIIYGVYGVKLG